ncbi:MAG: argininosuccinate lyase [Gammaproteobacteria bacterium]|nr:argininosuccinate lyase [Gammaproteobacteria bacterium]
MKQKKLWGGRFSTSTNDLMETYSASIGFDWRLYKYDIAGSIAHARMLCSQKILSDDEFRDIEQGLIDIQEDIEQGRFEWNESYEDIHMNIEANLTQRIGDAGKKLHTGRSRNDQIATDMRLYLREEIDSLLILITNVQQELVKLAAQEADTIMPGYTHMQSAQPVTFGHHLLAWNEMVDRDYSRISECRKRVNSSPLGSAALAGTSYDIDRQMTADELGFTEVAKNSLDAVSDRDFILEFNAHASLLMIHLSRMSEELVLWTSDGFNFVDLGDGFCTGSSIMPQKKNPDVAELTRGKCGRVTGNLMSLLMLMKGQPLAYNRDNQEDKEPLFDTVDTLSICLQVFEAMVPGIKANRKKMREAANKGYSTATDLADYLVRKSVPFRDAHEVVGKVVGYAVEQEMQLENIALGKLRDFSTDIEQDVYEVLTLEGSVNARDHFGGTAPKQVVWAASQAAKILAARFVKAS